MSSPVAQKVQGIPAPEYFFGTQLYADHKAEDAADACAAVHFFN